MSRIEKFQRILLFKLLYWIARLGLGLAFVASGIRKLPGTDITPLPAANPVENYFQSITDLGFYWSVIGIYQILVGFMALWNRWSALSGLLMLPFTVNIWLISLAPNFAETSYLSWLMLFSNLYFMIWHWQLYRPIFRKPDFKNLKLR